MFKRFSLDASEYYTKMRDQLFKLIEIETKQAESVRSPFQSRSRAMSIFPVASGMAGIRSAFAVALMGR